MYPACTTFCSSLAIHLLFGLEIKASPKATHFSRKSSPNHDQFWVFNSWNFEPGINQSDDDGCQMMEEPI